MSSLFDTIKVKSQYFIPKKLLSRLVGILASAEMGKPTWFLINRFINHYHVDMSISEIKDIREFKSFNDFFTRAIQKKARPLDTKDDVLTHPADGRTSEFGEIYKDAMLQAKGHYYSLNALLGGDEKDSRTFENGNFMTTYLSPADYHRVHMPFDGKLEKMIFVPGELFSVNPLTAANVDNLFAKNERVICFFHNEQIGHFAMVLVGATIVASIKTVFAGIIAPAKNKIMVYDYKKDNVILKKGAEMGSFLLGSTVICIFEKNKIKFADSLQCGNVTRMGSAFAEIKK